MTNSMFTKMSQLLKITVDSDWDTWFLSRYFRKTASYLLRCSCVGCNGRIEVRFGLYKSGRVVDTFREYDVFPEEEGKPWDVLEYASRQDVVAYLDKVRDYVNNTFGVADCRIAESVVISILCHEGNGMLLEELPRSIRTKKVCEAAVAEDWRAIKCVPKESYSATLCDIAVLQNGWAILDIPESDRTKELWMQAATQADCIMNDHPVLHMERPDKDVLKETIRCGQTGILWKIQSDPRFNGMVDELIDFAVEKISYALEDVSYKNMTRERCERALKAFGDEVLDFIPERLQEKYNIK